MPLRHITTSHFRAILQEQNRWKERSQELDSRAQARERQLVRILAPSLIKDEQRRHHLIIGPRRAGKSTVLWQTIRYLRQEGIPAERIYYLQMDHPELRRESLGGLVDELRAISTGSSQGDSQAVGFSHPKQEQGSSSEIPLFLIIDEIGFAEDWGSWLKLFHDERRPLRIIASSSSAADIMQGRGESGPGRWAEHFLMPCNFTEYVEFAFGADSVPKWCRTGHRSLRERLKAVPPNAVTPENIKNAVRSQILLSGYPECMLYGELPHDPDEVYKLAMSAHEYLRNVSERVIFRDIAQFVDIRDSAKLEAMLHSTAQIMAMLATPSGIARSLEMQSKTAREYIFHMERALILFHLTNFSDIADGSRSRMQKFCFHDGGMANAIRQSGVAVLNDPAIMGKTIENFVASSLKELAMNSSLLLNYWRYENKWEVDYIFDGLGKCLAIEVSLSKDYSSSGLQKLIDSRKEFWGNSYVVSPYSPMIHPEFTKDGIGQMPLHIFLLVVGAQSIQEMLIRGGVASASNYIIKQSTNELYSKYGSNRPSFTEGDIVFLTEQEAEQPLSQGVIEEGSPVYRV